MTDSPKPKLWGVKGAVEDIPPWDRANLRSCLGGDKEKKSARIESRITNAMSRAVNRLIQQRILPELETQSDVVEGGVSMILAYAKLHGRDSKDFRDAVNLMEWESQLSYIEQYYERVSAFLDRTEQQLTTAKAANRRMRFLKVFGLLEENRKLIEDEELEARASRLWMAFRDYAKELREKS